MAAAALLVQPPITAARPDSQLSQMSESSRRQEQDKGPSPAKIAAGSEVTSLRDADVPFGQHYSVIQSFVDNSFDLTADVRQCCPDLLSRCCLSGLLDIVVFACTRLALARSFPRNSWPRCMQ